MRPASVIRPSTSVTSRAVQLALEDERPLHVAGHEDLGLEAGARGIGRHRIAGVSRRGHRQDPGAEVLGAGHGRRETAGLERVGRVERFVLDEERDPGRAWRPSRGAWSNGVQPSPSETGASPSKSGMTSRYRHIDASRPARLLPRPALSAQPGHSGRAAARRTCRDGAVWRGSRGPAPQGAEQSRWETKDVLTCREAPCPSSSGTRRSSPRADR